MTRPAGETDRTAWMTNGEDRDRRECARDKEQPAELDGDQQPGDGGAERGSEPGDALEQRIA
jgi:hypothetical protein